MSLSGRPWFKWFPGDWKQDSNLRLCSLAARGLWVELLNIAHEADPRGHVKVGSISPTIEQISMIVGAPVSDVAKLLEELEAAGVTSRTEDGVLFSRRMVRDTEQYEVKAASGRIGGLARAGANDFAQAPAQAPAQAKGQAKAKQLLVSRRDPSGSGGSSTATGSSTTAGELFPVQPAATTPTAGGTATPSGGRQGGATAGPTGGGRAKSARDPAKRTPWQQLLDVYHEAFLEAHGKAPNIEWAKNDRSKAMALLKGPPARTVDELAPLLRRYVSMDDDWARAQGYPFAGFGSKINKLMVGEEPRPVSKQRSIVIAKPMPTLEELNRRAPR